MNNSFKLGNAIIEGLFDLENNAMLLKMKGVLYTLCAEFDEIAEYTERIASDTDTLFKMFEFAEKNYSGDCSLSALSKHTGFSYSYLSRYFKNRVGISFNTYVNHYRISKACYLLKSTKLSVTKCSLECGYTSIRSFNRNFLHNLGITPKEYRARNLQQE